MRSLFFPRSIHRSIALALPLFLAACSSNTSPSTSTGDPDCALKATLTGAVTATLTNPNSCGGDANMLSSGIFNITGNDPSTSIQVIFVSPLPTGQTGTFALQSVTVQQAIGDTMPTVWTIPGADCTFDVTSTTSSPTPDMPKRWLVVGNGSCTQPAVLDDDAGGGGASSAVTLGAFTLGSFYQTQ